MRLAFIGTSSLALTTAEVLLEAGHQVVTIEKDTRVVCLGRDDALGDCRKFLYQIAPDFPSPSRGANGRIVELCNGLRDAEGG
jgi:hypothetical protein